MSAAEQSEQNPDHAGEQ